VARRSRLTTEAARISALAAALLGIHSARGAGTDVSGFVGVWTFQGGSQIQAMCPSLGAVVEQLRGTRVSIYPGTSTDLVFDIGCRCTLGLDVTGNDATLAGTQPCLVIPRGLQLSGDISALTLVRSMDGTLTVTLAAANAALQSATASCDLSALSGSGTLARTGSGVVTCGDPSTAVGVMPYLADGTTDCPYGAGAEALRITMHDEDQPACSDSTGSRGEGRWVLPDDARQGPPVCTGSHTTVLDFCRVDGRLFQPLTTGSDPAQFYAVLKLGSVCPAGSIQVRKTIDNEDEPASADPSGSLGDLGPNEVHGAPPGTLTKLSFCYFRAAPSPDAVMAGFPDLGFPYAVYHRYAGEQPPWVMMKRWLYSNDEDNQPSGVNEYDSPDLSILPEFQGVIEDRQRNTVFDLARVR